MNGRNLTLLTDFYELNMMYAHYRRGTHEVPVVFDLFYRQNPCGGGYALAAGLESVIDFVAGLLFAPDDLDYLRSLNRYDEGFLDLLGQFRFTGDIEAIPEGTVVFPGEPLVRVKAPILQAQLLETALLTLINHQTLIATKSSRVVQAAGGDPVLEFGLRRAHGPDAGLYGARAAMIGGCYATSNVLAGKRFGARVAGTHAHSLVQFFDDEEEAFETYLAAFPDEGVLLVDTYHTLRSGLPKALEVFRRLRQAGHKPLAVRLDSGDLAYLSKETRKILDAAGFPEVKIVGSSDLDEYLIRDLKAQGARIDIWGVGTNLITSRDYPALGGVYKLAAVEENGRMAPRIKVSENPDKVTNPGVKKVIRLYDECGMAAADLIALIGEEIDPSAPLTLFDPVHTWKRKTLAKFTAKELLVPIFRGGELVYTPPDLAEIQARTRAGLATFWEEYRRLTNPAMYPVDLSEALWNIKQQMIRQAIGGPAGSGPSKADPSKRSDVVENNSGGPGR